MPSNLYANNESDGIGFSARNVLLILSLRTDKAWNSPVVTPQRKTAVIRRSWRWPMR